MIARPLAQQKQQLQRCIDGFLADALVSSAKLAASVAIAGLCLVGTGKYMDNAASPKRFMIHFLFASDAVALAVTAFWAFRARSDWQEWHEANSNRSELMGAAFAGQMEALNQSSLLWWHQQQAAFNWQMAQQFPQGRQQLQPVTVEAQPALSTAKPQPEDISRQLAQTLKSCIIVGQPGSGKGLVVAHAIRHIKIQHPDVTIWAIDPKADPGELNRWNPCDRLLDTALPAFANDRDIERFQDDVESFIESFKLVPGRKLLIFDEALAVKELMPKWFKGIMAGFNHLCSTGRSRGVFGWLISQTPNADDFGISGGARNVYRRVMLVSSDDVGLIVNRSTFFSGNPSDDELGVTGRVFFDSLGNRWGVVPRYPDINEPTLERTHGRHRESRHEALERIWNTELATPKHEQLYYSPDPEPDLSDDAITVLRYLQRNGPIMEVAKLKANLSGKPYHLPRAVTQQAIDELVTAEVAEVREPLIALELPFRKG